MTMKTDKNGTAYKTEKLLCWISYTTPSTTILAYLTTPLLRSSAFEPFNYLSDLTFETSQNDVAANWKVTEGQGVTSVGLL